jgi:hypothetical protein
MDDCKREVVILRNVYILLLNNLSHSWHIQNFTIPHVSTEPGWRSRYSDWLCAGQPSAGSGKIFVLSTLSRLVQGPTQPPFQWVLEGSFPGAKAAGV